MRQAFHIFQKDARYLCKELALVIGFAVIFAWAATHTENFAWAELLLSIAAAYLIARLIHAEPIPGDRQFWITRPYRWSSLLSAKILGLIVFVNLPIFIARLYVLAVNGFALETTLIPLAWSQLLIFVGASLPIAALAAITPSIVSFSFLGLVLVAASLVVHSSIAPPSLQAVRLMLSATQWVWHGIAFFTAIVVATPVIYLQYRKRTTLVSRCLMFSVAAMGAGAYIYVPWPVAAAIQTRISARRFDNRAVHVSLKPEAKRFFPRGMMWRYGVQIDVPLTIEGISNDVEVIPDAVTFTFQAPDGSTWKTGPYIYPPLGKQSPGAGPTTINANVFMPTEFFEKNQHTRLKITGSLYLTTFGNANETTIPIRNTPVNASDGVQCSLADFGRLSCRSAFRWPRRLIYARFQNDQMLPFTRVISYSPAPAGLDFYAVESRQVSRPSGEQHVTIVVKEPLSSFRHDFELDNFQPLTFSSR